MGLLSRVKGKVFERKLAAILRPLWPEAVVRRASQADRAHQADVYVTNGPPLLERLWIEAQDARNPTPLAKLEQAEGDIAESPVALARDRLPVVVWHRYGERTIQATTRLWVLDAMRSQLTRVDDSVVTMGLPEFLALVEQSVASGEREAA